MAFIQKRCHRCGRTVPARAQSCQACGSRDSVWRARYRGPDGAEHSKTFDRKTDAERWLSTQEADKARGLWVDPQLGRETFAAVWSRWRRRAEETGRPAARTLA